MQKVDREHALAVERISQANTHDELTEVLSAFQDLDQVPGDFEGSVMVRGTLYTRLGESTRITVVSGFINTTQKLLIQRYNLDSAQVQGVAD